MTPPNRNESQVIKFMILLGVFSIGYFLLYFFHPDHVGNPFLYILLSISILYSIAKKLYLWYNYSNISVPEPPKKDPPNLRVDVLTTYFPGEPYQMIITTLEAILDISYPHETYLCDEANDPYLKEFCRENGIHHVTRNDRKNAKAGNINNALKTIAKGDVCVILDPDHIPDPDFLDPIMPYFNDPEIGFVQIVQSYYNTDESLVAQGAAEQTFQFYGPVMMTLNAYGSVNAIGANCVFRRAALDSIGGHAPGLCEDMHTAMLLYSKGWKAVYLPVVLARGLAPSNLTSFFKQQLKWARGSFDLLLKVYPRIFHKLSFRQKLHFGILPMHYLSGLISLINFLIPILALFFATTPWRGNIIEFILAILPVIVSSILIRTYIQKWIIEKKERGFHLVGGLLHINTWWIYLLGLYYTIIDRKIPYLPTPKEDEWATNLKIIAPNAFVAFVSLIAVIYGLNQDFTPFSLVMAGFALFNAGIMSFGIYMAIKVSNQNKILNGLKGIFEPSIMNFKKWFYATANLTFNVTRILALPLLLVVLILSMSFKQQKTREKWEQVEFTVSNHHSSRYLGIFQPAKDDGLTELDKIKSIEEQHGLNFDIVSYYLAWNTESIESFPHQLTSSIFKKNAVPMITWEPWASGLPVSDTVPELKEEKKIFKFVSEGYYDPYIREFIGILKSYDKPFFLRFAHEFDNPQYPWSSRGNNTPEEFIGAWKQVHRLLREEDAHKVVLVWNPWKAEDMITFYPGNDYVDWIGVTALNYDHLNSNRKHTAFHELYEPFHDRFLSFTNKPVMLAEFGSLDLAGKQKEWIENAVTLITERYDEIGAVILFNSSFDKNIPASSSHNSPYLDWTVRSFEPLKNRFQNIQVADPKFEPDDLNETHPDKDHFLSLPEIQGVRYKKNIDWRQNYYALTKEEITEDLELMKQANINTILFKGGNIYDYNILKYTRASNLNILYSLDIDMTTDFVTEKEKKFRLREDILEKAQDLKDQENLLGYVFPGNLEDYFLKPELFQQRSAYFSWIKTVMTGVKEIDPERPVILELALNYETIDRLNEISQFLPVDSYGLVVKDVDYLEEVLTHSREKGIPVFISSIDPELFLKNKERTEGIPVVLQNWQNERLFNRLSFDGLLDFNGRKKRIFKTLESTWNGSQTPHDGTAAGILRPAHLLYPGNPETFHAVLFDGESWSPAQPDSKYTFEWHLIKNDEYGNPLALKKIGEGTYVDLEIPEIYERYELLLTAKAKDKDYVISTRSSLHTPLEQ